MKSGTSNVYIVNPDVAWTSYADQKSSCSFQANVVLSGTENPKATTRYKTVSDDFIQAVKANREEFEKRVEEMKREESA